MKKQSFFLIFLFSLLSIGGSGTAKAETVTINFSDESTFIINNAGTKGGVDNADIEMAGIRITTNGGYYEKTNESLGRLYIYMGKTFEVQSSVGNITKIEITGKAEDDAKSFAGYTTANNIASLDLSPSQSSHSTTVSLWVDIRQVVVTYTPASTATVTLAAACTDGERYYGTYSYSGSAFVVPSDLTVSEITVSGGKLQFSDYATGAIVPANTGVLVSSASREHTVVLSNAAGSSVLGSDNMLKPSGTSLTALAMSTAAPSCIYYRLTMHNGTVLGFYWGAEDGAAFDLGANKAYLAVPSGHTEARLSGFDMSDSEETAISAPVALPEQANGTAYNLFGMRVGTNWKGLVIINGKKCLNK